MKCRGVWLYTPRLIAIFIFAQKRIWMVEFTFILWQLSFSRSLHSHEILKHLFLNSREFLVVDFPSVRLSGTSCNVNGCVQKYEVKTYLKVCAMFSVSFYCAKKPKWAWTVNCVFFYSVHKYCIRLVHVTLSWTVSKWLCFEGPFVRFRVLLQHDSGIIRSES